MTDLLKAFRQMQSDQLFVLVSQGLVDWADKYAIALSDAASSEGLRELARLADVARAALKTEAESGGFANRRYGR